MHRKPVENGNRISFQVVTGGPFRRTLKNIDDGGAHTPVGTFAYLYLSYFSVSFDNKRNDDPSLYPLRRPRMGQSFVDPPSENIEITPVKNRVDPDDRAGRIEKRNGRIGIRHGPVRRSAGEQTGCKQEREDEDLFHGIGISRTKITNYGRKAISRVRLSFGSISEK